MRSYGDPAGFEDLTKFGNRFQLAMVRVMTMVTNAQGS